MSCLFQKKATVYELRNDIAVIQPRKKTTTYGIRSLSYIGAKLWNDMKFRIDDLENISIDDFKEMLNSWNMPEPNSTHNYV